tara:strand:+ start:717 stop:1478 length:762 start_codon:yes stop_codon:yes gene_type:complete
MKKVKETAAPNAEQNWEIKDRTYTLTSANTPLTHMIQSRNIFYFDEKLGSQRELKYTTNQKSPFVDEFKGDARLAHITFEDGVLQVPREDQTLQKLLSLYHPGLNEVYMEFNPVEEARDELADIELEIEALNIAKNLEIDHVEAILRVEQGSNVNELTSKELKRDILVLAKQNPQLLIDLAKDENVELRNYGIKAVEAGLLELSEDQRMFTWGKNKRKIMTVPFDEHPYSALAAFFKTDEGLEIYKNIEKRLK